MNRQTWKKEVICVWSLLVFAAGMTAGQTSKSIQLEQEALQDDQAVRIPEDDQSAVQPSEQPGAKPFFKKSEYAHLIREANEEKQAVREAHRRHLAELGSGDDLQRKEIEKTYQAELDRIDTELEYAIAKLEFPEWDFEQEPQDNFAVRELRIQGNTVLSSDELLRQMPVVYPVLQKDSEGVEQLVDLYDFYPVKKLLFKPDETQKISQKTIQGLTQYILSAYQEEGYGGIYVYVSAEVINEGQTRFKDDILTIQVLEAKLSRMNVDYYVYDPNSEKEIPYIRRDEQSSGYLREAAVKKWSPVQEGQVTSTKKVQEYCNILNLNPDRYVTPIISRGDSSETLGLDYRIYENRPWHFYFKVDNSGSYVRQWNPTVGVINTNLTGRDDKLTALFQGSFFKEPAAVFERNYSVFGSYEFPLFTPELRLNLYAGYSDFEDDSAFAGGIINFLGTGTFAGAILKWHVFQVEDFMANTQEPWFFDLTASISDEQSNVNPSVGLSTDVWWNLWGIGAQFYRTQRADRQIASSLSANFYSTFNSSSDESFSNQPRPNAERNFTIFSASAAHSQYLTEKQIHRVLGSVNLIWPTERLISAKMTTFGGLYSVRGYKENDTVADGGILASAQYEFDLVKYYQNKDGISSDSLLSSLPWLKKMALLMFTDYGHAENKEPIPAGEIKSEDLLSIGCGLHTQITEKVNIQLYYGMPLLSTEDTQSGEGRWNLAFMYNMRF